MIYYLQTQIKRFSFGSHVRTELIAGFSSYITLSYNFIVIPVLLNKAGINLSAAFFATVISAALSTFAMGAWARLPMAVGPVATVATFLVSYVCGVLKLSWQEALTAVAVSGLIGVLMTALSVRQRLISVIPDALKLGVLFAVGGFISATGLMLSKIIKYHNGFIDISALSLHNFTSNSAIVLYVGLLTAVIFRLPWLKLQGGPLFGLLIATIVAKFFGISAHNNVEVSAHIFDALFQIDLTEFFTWHFMFAAFVFFLVDFYGAVGKFIGLFSVRGATELSPDVDLAIGRALYVDSAGTFIGGLLGTSSSAVLVSSAVGIMSGGRTGLTAIFCSLFIICSLALIPLVGIVPVEATAGVLVYVGLMIIPWPDITGGGRIFRYRDIFIAVMSWIISTFTFGIDKAMLLPFAVYSFPLGLNESKKYSYILMVTALLLALSVVLQIALL